MSRAKRSIRDHAREATWKRDGQRCVMCGRGVGVEDPAHGRALRRSDFDAHHITPRRQMPNGGTVTSNLITLCWSCHDDAEQVIHAFATNGVKAHMHRAGMTPQQVERFTASNLYKMIGSSYEAAISDSEAL